MANRRENATSRAKQPERPLSLTAVLRRTALLWRPYLHLAIPLAVALVFQSGFRTLLSVQFKSIIDNALLGRARELLLFICIQLLVGYVVAALASIAADYLSSQIGARILNDLRLSMFTRMQAYSVNFFKSTPSGDIVARYTSDLSEIEKGLTTRFTDAHQSVIGLLMTVPVLFFIQWKLTLIALALLPVVSLGTRLFTPRAFGSYLQLKREQGALASTIHENIQAQPIVKMFNLDGSRKELFKKQLVTLQQRTVGASYYTLLVATISSLGVSLVHLLIVVIGAYFVSKGLLSVGGLVAYLGLLGNVSNDTYTLSKRVIPNMIAVGSGFRRIDELLAVQPQVVDSPQAFPLPPLSREICFEHVSFRYEDGDQALSDVSLVIPAGRYVVFVGKTGSGKSTIINLLARFYDPTSGRVLFDGVDLRDVTQRSLREQIAAVFQDTFLFNSTIRDNIRQGKLAATDEEVVAAAQAAEVHDAILNLPKGYDTPVGETGGLLSGGQRQRIAIARAIIRNPALLILDEPTSGLDMVTEAALAETLARLAQHRTVIVVTHRHAPMRRAEYIFVVDAGQILEQGTPKALLARQGAYSRLVAG